MRRTAVVVGIVLALVVGGLVALGRAAGVGPFAPGAPASWVYIAISRGSEEGDAREVEVVDLATGEHRVFAVDDRVLDLALSRDRRTLYVANGGDHVIALDAVSGTRLGEIRLDSAIGAERIIALARDDRIAALGLASAAELRLSIVDTIGRREAATAALGRRLVGTPLLRADGTILVPLADRIGAVRLLAVQPDSLELLQDVEVGRQPTNDVIPLQRNAGPLAALGRDGSVAVLDPVRLVVTTFAASLDGRRDASLAPLFLDGRPLFASGTLDGDVAITATGTIHACLATSARAERYVIDPSSLAVTRAGGECGRFAIGRDGALYLGVRGKPTLAVLDPTTGALVRTVTLAGFARRVVS